MIDRGKQVFVLHNQSCADAAAELGLPQPVCALDVDWGDLAGCRLVLWPANTPLSRAAMATNARLASQAGAASVKLVTPGALDPPGWDAAEALRLGWDKPDVVAWLRAQASEVTAPEAAQVVLSEHHYLDDGSEPAMNGYSGRVDIRTEAEVSGREQLAPDGWDASASLQDRWAMLGLETTKSGPVANEDTVLRCLERHPNLVGMVWYDEFLQRVMTHGANQPREWGDADDGRLLSALQRDLGISRIKPSHVRLGVLTYAYANTKNCAKDWLKSLKWDGVERIAAFFPDFCGSQDTAYARAVGRNFFISMVARVFEPGCKVDNMIVLEGAQGGGKSSMLEAIGGNWYSVQHEQVTGKGFFETLQGRMLVEIAEMDAFGKAEVTRVKQVVTTRSDRYRAAYAHAAKDYPRTSVFAGTTNKDDWNRDETGARRFWPIRVEQAIDVKAVAKARNQLFAEAVLAYYAKPVWWVVPMAETEAEQEARRDEDAWADPVREWLVGRTEVSVRDVLVGAINLTLKEIERPEEMRMAKILRELKWTKRPTRTGKVWSNPVVLLPLGGNG